MGGNESTEKVLNELNLTQDLCNEIIMIQETNTDYTTKSSTTIENTFNNMMETVQKSKTESNNSVSTVISVDINMVNNMENNEIVLNGATNVDFKQSNRMTNKLTSYNNFDHKVWNESNVLMNVDADIISQLMSDMSVQNQTTASQAAEDQLQNAISQINQMAAALEDNKETNAEGELNNIVNKLGESVNTLINGIFGKETNSETSNIQNIKSTIKNHLERKNITNATVVTECVVNTAFVFNNTNTVKNYCSTISSYQSQLQTLMSAKMVNNFNNNKITITNSDNITFDQENCAEQELVNSMIASITTGNYFGNSSSTEVSSQTSVENYIKNENTTSASQTAKSEITNEMDNLQEQTATNVSTEKDTSTSVVSALGMGLLGPIIAIVVVLVIIKAIANKGGGAAGQNMQQAASFGKDLLRTLRK